MSDTTVSHGRKPPPPVRGGPTRSTFDSCPFMLAMLLVAWPYFLVKGLRMSGRRSERKPRAWRVVRQYSYRDDVPLCSHRWGWVAEICAHRRVSSNPHDIGTHYSAQKISGKDLEVSSLK